MQRLADRPEILDGPSPDRLRLRQSLRDLRRANRFLGGEALSRAAVLRLAPELGRGPAGGRRLRLLDVGTGLGDIPVALLRWSASRGVEMEIEAVDARPETIALAREEHGAVPGLRLAVAEGRSLPYADATFDLAHSSLVGHHLEPEALLDFLSELRRVSRRGVIMNDLDRNLLALSGAWILSRIFSTSRITRHDAPLSVRRAYRAGEMAAIAARAGLREAARVRGFAGYRYAAIFVPAAGEPEATPTRMDRRD